MEIVFRWPSCVIEAVIVQVAKTKTQQSARLHMKEPAQSDSFSARMDDASMAAGNVTQNVIVTVATMRTCAYRPLQLVYTDRPSTTCHIRVFGAE
eukprot:m.198103 g.198103  ORF g.198103 m.198103 type:complete len:95 (-) comp18734_c0_seq1:1024-1308(-)